MLKRIYYKFVGPSTRYSYWSHSKFANWLRKIYNVEIPPSSATTREWREYSKRNEGTFGYWIVEEGLNNIQDIVNFPHDVYRNVRYKIKNRFRDKLWCLDTNLNKWEYHENSTRFVYGLFETLVQFVEHEKAHMQHVSEMVGSSPGTSWKEKVSRWNVATRSKYPSREMGLKYLDWEISLGDKSPLQSAAAVEVKELYLWWKDVHSTRPDPMDASGWSDYCDKKREKGKDGFWNILDSDDKMEADRQLSEALIKKVGEIELEQESEDTEMLIRLINIRNTLWT